jgi:hypothetical protein
MKILKIIILIALVVSFMPLDAFCEDHHDEVEHHHGIVLCHGSCHGAILANSQSFDLPEIIISFSWVQNFSYDEPILPTDFRPPITIS